MGFWTWWTQYYPPKPTFTEKNLPSLRGKVFLITGGSAGLGRELSKMLYNSGGTVYITARTEVRS
jgi:5,10-methylene-tetrahydrofolate dehydrogenase/methenyl tetrahydrofolate cyclohydrolase